MTKLRDKPVLHGRDHSPGGADPIPGLGGGGIDFDTYPQDGQWLYIETTGSDTTPSGFGMEFYDSGENGIDMASAGCHLRLNEFGSNDAALTAGDDLTLAGGDDVSLGAGDGLLLKGKTATLSSNVVGSPRLTQVDSPDQVLIQGGISPQTITLDDTDGIVLDTLGGASIITLYAEGYYGELRLSAGGGGVNYTMVATGGVYGGFSDPGHFVSIPAGTMFEITAGVGGSPIFKVDHSSGGAFTYHIRSGGSWVADL